MNALIDKLADALERLLNECDTCDGFNTNLEGPEQDASEEARRVLQEYIAAQRTAPTPAQPAATVPMRQPRPVVVIHMLRGQIEDIVVSEPIDVLTIDYYDDKPDTIPVDQGEGRYAQAKVKLQPVDFDAPYAVGRVIRYINSLGKEC